MELFPLAKIYVSSSTFLDYRNISYPTNDPSRVTGTPYHTPMTKNLNTTDNKTDRSDVLSLLTTIDSMFHASQNTLNEYSRTSLLLSIIIEGQMLLTKLSTMFERWKTHLPFKEASGVDFFDWKDKVEDMRKHINGEEEGVKRKIDAYCPSKHFLLDLYAILPKSGQENTEPYYKETDVPTFIHTQERMRRTIASRWPEYKHKLSEHTLQNVSERFSHDLKNLHDDASEIQQVCNAVLTDLVAELSQLSDMSLRVIKGDEYARLAYRIANEQEYDVRKAHRDAQAYFSKWKNSTPDEREDSERRYEIEMAVNFISEMKYGRLIGNYVHLKDDMDRQMKGVGKFLYTFRQKISIDELHSLMEQLYRIHFFLEDERNSKAESAIKPDNTTTEVVMQAVTPDANTEFPDIELPTFFHHDLRTSEKASAAFLRTLCRVCKYMGRNLTAQEKNLPEAKPYIKWKFNHLLQAFKDMSLVGQDITQVEFAKFLVDVLPGRKVDNIKQSLYRNCDKKSESILADVKDEFGVVIQLMRPK